jgi:hypothetical protein
MPRHYNNALQDFANLLPGRITGVLAIGVAAVTLAAHSEQAIAASPVTGGAPLSEPSSPLYTHAQLNRLVQIDINDLASEALASAPSNPTGGVSLGGSENVTRTGKTAVVTETVSAPSFNGSDRGEYFISFIANASLKGNVFDIEIGEGTTGPNGQFIPYSQDNGVISNTGGAVASFTHNFNIPMKKQCEAAVNTRYREQQLTFTKLSEWDEQAEGILEAANQGSDTRDLLLPFQEPQHDIPYAL